MFIREMQIKTTFRYYFIPIRMAKINMTLTSTGENVEKSEPFNMTGGIVKWFSHFGKGFGGSAKC